VLGPISFSAGERGLDGEAAHGAGLVVGDREEGTLGRGSGPYTDPASGDVVAGRVVYEVADQALGEGGVTGGGRRVELGVDLITGGPGHDGIAAIVRHRAFAFSCKLPRPGRCDARLTIAAGAARALGLAPRRGAKTFTLGTARVTLPKAGVRTVRIRLTRPIARALSRAHSLRVTLTVTARYPIGSRTATERLTLKR
jgi:hypothetical protein